MATTDSSVIRNHAAFIWSVADLLRGDYKPSEYGRIVLPLNDTESLWLIAGAPLESFPIGTQGFAAELGHLYPDGVAALPPELDAWQEATA